MAHKDEWRKFKYQYTDSGFLRFLVDILGEKGVEASVFLEPNELLGELKEERNRFLKMDKETFGENLEAYKEFLSKLRNKNIIPGGCLSFDYGYSQNSSPEIKSVYDYPLPQLNKFSVVNDELIRPSNFTGLKYEAVSLSDFEGEKSIRRLKEAVAEFSERGYTLIRVSASLNPQPYTHDHYYSGVDYDGHLFAREGNMEIMGNFPEDFNFGMLVPKKLPGRQKMIEHLVKENEN